MRVWALAAAFLVAGCTTVESEGRELSIDPEADSEACIGAACRVGNETVPPPPVHRVGIQVVDAEAGTPFERAPVAALEYRPPSTSTSGWHVVYIETQEHPGRLVGEARTDADGMAWFEVPPGMPLSFAVAAKERTTEVIAGVVAGPDQGRTEYVIPVYRQTLEQTFSIAQPTPGSWCMTPETPILDVFPAFWSQDAAIHAAYQQRMRTFSAAVSWQNELGSTWSDVHLRAYLEADQEASWTGSNEDHRLQQGDHRETVFVDEGALKDHRNAISLGDTMLETRCNTFQGSPFGMELHYEVAGTFRSSDLAIINP